MAATDPNLAALSAPDRQLVESWLAEFDQSWKEDLLKAWLRKLPSPGDPKRLPALVEMVKIDLEWRWQKGKGVRLEKYLANLPELGTPETVSADLILAEYEARREAGVPKPLEAFMERFPHLTAELSRLAGGAEGPGFGAKLVQSTPHSMSADVPTPLPAASATPAGSLPKQIGRYLILKELGEGGMGAVYLAEDPQLERRVALKVPKYADPEALQRFFREAKAAAKLHHPNICPVFESGESDGVHFLTMAYIEGNPLSDLVAPGRPPMPQGEAAEIVAKVALALKEAHAHGIIHRDLKPSNIMIDQRREPILMDFGLARRVHATEEHLTKTGEMFGTPAYMPPEQARGDVCAMGPGCDIYSLGVILYQLLTQRLPFSGPTVFELANKILNDPPEPPRTFRPDLDPRLEAVCLKAMAKQVDQRFASMDEMAAALRDCLAHSSRAREHAPCRNPPPRSKEPRSDRVPEIKDDRHFRTVQPVPGARLQPQRLAPKQARSPVVRRHLPLWLVSIAAFAVTLFAAIVIVFRTDEGDVRIELSDPRANVKVEVDGSTIDITGLEKPLRLKLGDHKLVVTGEDFDIIAPESFTVKRWGNPVVQVTLIRKRVQPAPVKPDRPADRQAPRPRPTEDLTNSIGMKLVLIPAGKFLMGSPDGEEGRDQDESPQHVVEITQAFYLGKYEVTVGQFCKFVEETGYRTDAEKDGQGGEGYDAATNEFKRHPQYSWRDPGFPQSDEHPVVNVTWNDAVTFCDWLGKKEGKKYRLPTEAEWEYSCRARTQTRYHSGDDSETLAAVGNVVDASARGKFPDWSAIKSDDGHVFTAPVACFNPNGFGLHDMHGNVWEWCQDWFDRAYYEVSPKQDPQGPRASTLRVLRGGSFNFASRESRAANRGWFDPADRRFNVGFRVVCVVDPRSTPGAKPPVPAPGTQSGEPTSRNLVSEAAPHEKRITNSIGMELVLIPPGKFMMGSPASDHEADAHEKPQHEVEITKAFYLGKYEVTHGQFLKFVKETGYRTEAEKDGKGGDGYDAKTNSLKGWSTKYSWRDPGFDQTDDHPVVNVTWKDAVAFCDWLSQKEGKKYRLPTEAEWEYSCRAGTQSRYCTGDDSESVASVGNFADASAKRKFLHWTTIRSDDGHVFNAPVGSFKPNGFGLYDMHGNVWEWCRDRYNESYYEFSPKHDPQGPKAGTLHVIRGGSHRYTPGRCRSADRTKGDSAVRYNDLGFRVVLVP